MRDTDEQTIETQAAGVADANPTAPDGAGDAALAGSGVAQDGHDGHDAPPASQPAGPGAATASTAAGSPAGPGAAASTAAEQDGGAERAAAGTAGEPVERDALQVDVEELLQAVAKRDEYLALAQRTQADFENYRKRAARESVKGEQRGVAKLARELLPALDNLDRAIDAAADGDPLLEGVKLVRKELGAALARLRIEPFSPKGEPFDPALHEAVAQQPVDGADSGCVAEVYQAGYRLGEQVIRPARVLVAA